MTKFILDAGHGGMAFGNYLTPGKRSPEVPPGIYEGEFNRNICFKIWTRCVERNIECVRLISDSPINIPLSERIEYINQLYKKEKDIVLLSIHANASGYRKWVEEDLGFVTFVSHNSSLKSKQFAYCISKSMEKFGPIPHRDDKMKNFSIIKKTHCPAVLLECGFMTNHIDAEILASDDGRQAIADATIFAIKDFMSGSTEVLKY
jgi:N-acetylmuramoyl-L-alanine amidase